MVVWWRTYYWWWTFLHISCSVHQRRIPEYLMDSVLEVNLGNIFQKNMETEVPVTTLPRTESLSQIRALNTLEVANGTTSPALASSNLTHGTEFLSFRSEFYKYTNYIDTACTPCDQIKTSEPEPKTKNKRVCLFPSWLACAC